MHYLDVRKKRSQNEFEEDIDRELEWNQWNLLEKWKGKMIGEVILNPMLLSDNILLVSLYTFFRFLICIPKRETKVSDEYESEIQEAVWMSLKSWNLEVQGHILVTASWRYFCFYSFCLDFISLVFCQSWIMKRLMVYERKRKG